MAEPRSGQITVTIAGTAVRGTNVPGREFVIKAMAGNTGVVYVGNDGSDDVASTTGFPLAEGEAVPVFVNNLNDLWFDSAENGDKVAWIKYN